MYNKNIDADIKKYVDSLSLEEMLELLAGINGLINKPKESTKSKTMSEKKVSKSTDGTITISDVKDLNKKILSPFYFQVKDDKLTVYLIKSGADKSIEIGEKTSLKSVDEVNSVFEILGVKTRIVLNKPKYVQFSTLMEILSKCSIGNVGGVLYIDNQYAIEHSLADKIFGNKFEVIKEDGEKIYILVNDKEVGISKKLQDKTYKFI